MKIDRRQLLRKVALGAGGTLFMPFAGLSQAAPAEAAGPRRVVFFLQNHGFHPAHALPEGVSINENLQDRVENVSLASLKLPSFIDPLTPYKDRLTIIQGLNGKHVNPYHGAPFGALGGFRKTNTEPLGETIDCALSQVLPAVVPMLALGWADMSRMENSPITYASSAWGAGKTAPMICNPNLAYQNLFGVAKPGKSRDEFEADTALFEFVQKDTQKMQGRLAGPELDKFRPYAEGFGETAERRRRLLAMAKTLEKHAPAVTEQFTKPRYETDWWEAGLSVGLSAMIAGVTNVLTLCSGVCEAGGSWQGLGLSLQGHGLGHASQLDHPDWLKLRRYNMEMIVKIIKALEAVPEGKGNMMDNTLIVYTSDFGEKQHSIGNRWPFLLIGNLGGKLRTGRYLQYPLEPRKQSRTINALYCTLLHAVGSRRDHFNLTGGLKGIDRPGPLSELLA